MTRILPHLRTPARVRLARTGFGLLLGAVALCSGCAHNREGSGGTSKAPDAPAVGESSAGKAVKIDSFQFQPATLEVTPGTTVTWKNSDASAHTVTSDPGQNGSLNGTLKGGGGTYSYTFKNPGEYAYHCEYHSGMKGKVIVK